MATAYDEMKAAGLNPLFGSQQYRSKEEQAKLMSEGKSKTMNSLHMKGLAVDMYNGSPDKPPTAEQIAIMNKNGWYQDDRIKSWDPGHFEFK